MKSMTYQDNSASPTTLGIPKVSRDSISGRSEGSGRPNYCLDPLTTNFDSSGSRGVLSPYFGRQAFSYGIADSGTCGVRTCAQ